MTCRVCGAEKQPEQMKLQLGKRTSMCKDCDAARSRAYARAHKAERQAYNKAYRLRPEALATERERQQRRQADPEYRASQRERHRRDRATDSVRERNKEYQRQYAQQRADAVAAHMAVRAALRTGDLVKPLACQRCGQAGRLHSHHNDYSKPLEVAWVCPLCHKAIHKERAA